eukprot:698658-Hanusia_phi.AAC.1
MYFEICEYSKDLCKKIYQMIRFSVLQDDFLGENSEIAVMGLLLNGPRESFQDACKIARQLYSKA